MTLLSKEVTLILLFCLYTVYSIHSTFVTAAVKTPPMESCLTRPCLAKDEVADSSSRRICTAGWLATVKITDHTPGEGRGGGVSLPRTARSPSPGTPPRRAGHTHTHTLSSHQVAKKRKRSVVDSPVPSMVGVISVVSTVMY